MIEFDKDELSCFFDKFMKAGNSDFKRQLSLFLEGLGMEFLRVIEDEIIRREVLDTRLLLDSFHKGNDDGIWELSEDGLTLQVGSNVEYAGYVNDGHRTCKNGEEMRFVPGDVVTDSSGKIIEFHYNKNAKTGMMLKQKWVEGKHFWEIGIRIIDRMMPELLEAKLQQWLDSYFG